LPDAWDGSFLFWGNGGFAGSLQAVDDGTYDFLLTFGLAVAATEASQAIVQAYYAPPYSIYYGSYFDGCSTGGWQGLVEAQKFPQDYRVIVVGDPAGIENTIAGLNWNDHALLKSPAGYLSPSNWLIKRCWPSATVSMA